MMASKSKVKKNTLKRLCEGTGHKNIWFRKVSIYVFFYCTVNSKSFEPGGGDSLIYFRPYGMK